MRGSSAVDERSYKITYIFVWGLLTVQIKVKLSHFKMHELSQSLCI